jgi:hypothetical protein
MRYDWPRRPTRWLEGRTLNISVPFTWNLPQLRRELQQRILEWDRVVVGGPAVELMPTYFEHMPWVSVGKESPGVLQRINPFATKTTRGCNRSCPFCAVPRIEGRLQELPDWPDLPILIDNNFLAASEAHIERAVTRLSEWGYADFNQGVDARKLTPDLARQLARIKSPIIRLALDNIAYCDAWQAAVDNLLSAGVRKRCIRSLVLIGFDSDPQEAWSRCRYIESKGIKPAPMWYHALDCKHHNSITAEQRSRGWNDYERRRIMQWFYQHKKATGGVYGDVENRAEN